MSDDEPFLKLRVKQPNCYHFNLCYYWKVKTFIDLSAGNFPAFG